MSQVARLDQEATASPGLPERVLLQYEVEQFLYHEAALLDDRRFGEWLALIADDIHYWMPIRRTVTVENLHLEYAGPDGMAYFDDDRTDPRDAGQEAAVELGMVREPAVAHAPPGVERAHPRGRRRSEIAARSCHPPLPLASE